MSKKVKKLFKPQPRLPSKVTLNRRWTAWRPAEIRSLQSNTLLNTITFKAILPQFDDNMNTLVQNKLFTQSAIISKSKNYCYYIGRARSFSRKLFMSRHALRQFARFGMLPGFTKERK